MIDALFAYAGIDDSYTDAFGATAWVRTESKLAILNALGYPVGDDASATRVLRDARMADSAHVLRPVYVVREGRSGSWPGELRGCVDPEAAPGYYDLEIGEETTRLIVAPANAYVDASVDRHAHWGIGAQLYALRSERNWGIGDFGDLAGLVETAHRAGASFLALNPLHQLHLSDPDAASPYAPLSRGCLNALYIDLDSAAREFKVDLSDISVARLRETHMIDYAGVAQAKLRAFERLFTGANNAAELDAFVADNPSIKAVALYEAIMEFTRASDREVRSWLQWPPELRDYRGNAVRRFAEKHAERVRFYVFLQWLANRQLARVAERGAGMAIGIYRDLAVGVDLASADVWADPDAFALGLSVGAPPDPLNEAGQNWGLPPLHPRALIARAYEPFVELLRANMQHAGALRIDHVMGLKRLFCIPRSYREGGGAYVNYDFEAMLGIVALESHRNRCMIVGEDLGTVPEGFRERLVPERIFSCRVLPFERDGAGFRAGTCYPRDSVASTGTHDLPPFAAWWDGADQPERERFLDACATSGVAGLTVNAGTETALEAAYRFLARSNSALVLAQLEDLLAQREQVNVPGTTTEEPNWKRKYSVTVGSLEMNGTFAAIARALRAERPLDREARI